jgi:23S rRNA (adenine2503-C2)-methyltransferase
MWNNIKRIDDAAQNVGEVRLHQRMTRSPRPCSTNTRTYDERTVICCSTQSGCPVGCRFCGAGDYFVRSLTADEIVSQPKYLLDRVLEDHNV